MIELFIAFGAGFISFLSPCVLPLIPGYISYISGNTLEDLIKNKKTNLFPIILFTVGFSVIFISFGASASFLGKFLLNNSFPLRIIAGIIIIIFSLHILGVFKISFLNYEKRIYANKSKNIFSPIVLGMAFAFGWTPCIGPILGSILALSATDASISKGILLLSFYSLGLAIPFILSGYYMNSFLISKKGFGKYYNRITITGGIILLITGILIATNQIQVISYYILTTFPFLTSLG